LSSTQQRLTVGQGGDHRLDQVAAGLLAESQCNRDSGRDQAGIGDRDQVDEPHPVGVLAGYLRCYCQREPGLAHAARTDRSHLTMRHDHLGQLSSNTSASLGEMSPSIAMLTFCRIRSVFHPGWRSVVGSVVTTDAHRPGRDES